MNTETDREPWPHDDEESPAVHAVMVSPSSPSSPLDPPPQNILEPSTAPAPIVSSAPSDNAADVPNRNDLEVGASATDQRRITFVDDVDEEGSQDTVEIEFVKDNTVAEAPPSSISMDEVAADVETGLAATDEATTPPSRANASHQHRNPSKSPPRNKSNGNTIIQTPTSNEDASHMREQRMLMFSASHGPGERSHSAHALVRKDSSALPMNTGVRRRKDLIKTIKATVGAGGGASGDDDEETIPQSNASMRGRMAASTRNIMATTSQNTTQYKLKAMPRNTSFWQKLGLNGDIYEDARAKHTGSVSCLGFSPNQFVINYLHWTFRSSFAAVFLSAAFGFLAWTMLFALIIWGIGKSRPTCIGGVDFNSAYFTDAYVLSWTTFSTVGYGLIYSATSNDEPDISKCTDITIVVTLEAFIGVLYGALCGAIIFAKVTRVQSFAQVSFSNPIVIRYGSGVRVEMDDEPTSTEAGMKASSILTNEGDAQSLLSKHLSTISSINLPTDENDDSHNKEEKNEEQTAFESMNSTFTIGQPQDDACLPCPVLEFRVVNRLSNIAGGEILDATVNIVASIEASQACLTVRNAVRKRRKKGKKGGPRSQRSNASKSLTSKSRQSSISIMDRSDYLQSVSSLLSHHSLTKSLASQNHQAFEEDPTGHLVPKRIFSKLEVETFEHPFFKRVWTIRHKLDDNSPLLRNHARELVKANGGFWPVELNNPDGVRSAVHFDQILVSLSGTSNADANSVYSQKIYEFVDINVGYRLANMLYRSHDGMLKVDMRLLNDVNEQAGGGGEELDCRPQTIGDQLADMLIL